MDDLEVFKLSAEACGYTLAYEDSPYEITGEYVYVESDDVPDEWNPFLNAEQRWQCVRKLLEMRKVICLNKGGGCISVDQMAITYTPFIECPAEQFPARALAELQWKAQQREKDLG